ncbi:MAG: hypothetical protein WCO00_10285 [Rhodospirillaceae bacterium]
MLFHRLSRVLAIAAVLAAVASGAGAGERDHDRARAAVEAGETRPLAEILASVGRDYPGEVIDVELEEGHHGWGGRGHGEDEPPIIYEVKVRTADGRILKLCYDARTGALRSVRKR